MTKIKILIYAIVLLSLNVYAGVSLKNGNFYIEYTDLVIPGGNHDLIFSRTYNSRAINVGFSGFGWGSDFETSLTPEADGSVVVHENGSGAKTRFIPRGKINAKQAARDIVSAMRSKGVRMSKIMQKKLIKDLAANAERRQSYARKFGVKKHLAKGTVLYSNVRGMQKIVKTKDGYKRTNNNGKTEYFDEKGHYIKYKDKSGYTLKLVYKSDKLKYIKNSLGKQMNFTWYPNGLLKSVYGTGSKKTTYIYDAKKNLIKSIDVEGHIYKYDYDGNHNMLKVTYQDGQTLELKYEKSLLRQIKNKDGSLVRYDYKKDRKNPNGHYWTIVSKNNNTNKWIHDRYEYNIKTRPDGSKYTYQISTEINGYKISTIYSECCGAPLRIQRGKDVTTFDYNSDGLLTKKSSSRGEYVELKYHPTLKKITQVISSKTGKTSFAYDKKGNLTKAISSKSGEAVMLIYNWKNKIVKMISYNKKLKKKKILGFRYNSLGKPVVISMQHVGKIFVSYDDYGEIKKVDSKQGHKMALQVTRAFQSLIKVVKPAGVNFNI